MTTKAHLVPTPITDRNGKQTTTYVKQQAATSSRSIPAPVPLSPAQRLEQQLPGESGTLAHNLRRVLVNRRYRLGVRAHDKMLSGLHPDTLPKLQADIDSEKLELYSVIEVMEACAPVRNFALLNNLALFSDIPVDEGNRSSFHWYPGGLQKYRDPDTEMIDYSIATEEDKRTARVLIIAATRLKMPNVRGSSDTANGPMVFLTSGHLRRLIASRPHDVEAITSLINERSLHPRTVEDIESIVWLLDSNDNPALREGTL